MPDKAPFDMALSFPQWQGSGRADNLKRGGLATAEVCADYGPRHDVAIGDAGAAAHGINNWTALHAQLQAAQSLLNQHRPKRLLTAGGDCAVDVPVIDYLSGLYPDLTVIWIDAHLDANSPATSPSGNFHGMPVRTILGDVPDALASDLRHPINPNRFFYHGARVADQGDLEFALAKGLRSLPDGFTPDGPVHIHFDLDSLDPAAFPYLAYPEPNGLDLDAALKVVTRLAATGRLVGLTIAEFSPANDAEAAAGQAFIRRICQAAT